MTATRYGNIELPEGVVVVSFYSHGQVTDHNVIRRMRFARGIKKATDKHSEYVTLPAFPRQQMLANAPNIAFIVYFLSYLGFIQAASKSKAFVIDY
jgi:hypothetical protein